MVGVAPAHLTLTRHGGPQVDNPSLGLSRFCQKCNKFEPIGLFVVRVLNTPLGICVGDFPLVHRIRVSQAPRDAPRAGARCQGRKHTCQGKLDAQAARRRASKLASDAAAAVRPCQRRQLGRGDSARVRTHARAPR